MPVQDTSPFKIHGEEREKKVKEKREWGGLGEGGSEYQIRDVERKRGKKELTNKE